jgi:hypothetical protein
MPGPQDRPLPADFGIGDETASGLPRPFVASHRWQLLLCGYLLVLAAAAAAILSWAGSLAAAVLFGGLAVAAASVLLLPAFVGALCAAEVLEDSWLCRRSRAYRAWSAYRRALEEFEARRGARDRRRAAELAASWAGMDLEGLRHRVPAALAADRVRLTDRTATGVDLLLERDGSTCAVRLEPGTIPVGPAVGRELVAARLDLQAERAVLVAPAGATPELIRYAARHGIEVLDASALAACGEGSEEAPS